MEQPDFSADPSAPDRIPDDLLSRYGRGARKTVKHNRSRSWRLVRQARHSIRETDAELWQTTAVLFLIGVISVCGLGALAYAVYLWPKIGLALIGTVLVLFVLSFFLARRFTRRNQDPSEREASWF